MSAYAIYAILLVASLGFGVLLLNVSRGTITDFGRYLAWVLVGCGALMVVLIPFVRRRFDRYLTRMQKSDIK